MTRPGRGLAVPPRPAGLTTGQWFSALDMTHKCLQDNVIEAALVQGWQPPYFTHRSENSPAGFPDLVMVRLPGPRGCGRHLYAELKRQDDDLRPAQRDWRDWLFAVDVEHYVWKPSDLLSGEIDAVLAMRTKPVMMRRPLE